MNATGRAGQTRKEAHSKVIDLYFDLFLYTYHYIMLLKLVRACKSYVYSSNFY
jgi:hypothetical protein